MVFNTVDSTITKTVGLIMCRVCAEASNVQTQVGLHYKPIYSGNYESHPQVCINVAYVYSNVFHIIKVHNVIYVSRLNYLMIVSKACTYINSIL